MAAIKLSEVKLELINITKKIEECGQSIKNINDNYIEGTESQWNSVLAAEYIDGLCNSINDFVNQYNEKLPTAIAEFVKGVNFLAEHEKAELVNTPILATLTSVSKKWVGQAEDFNRPDNYALFTQNNLIIFINELIQNINAITMSVNNAVANGLNNQYCTKISEAIADLNTSATKVATEYSADAAKAASNEDTAHSTMMSNT